MAEERNALSTSKKLLPYLLVGGLILVFLIGFLLVVTQKNNPGSQNTISGLPAYPTAQPQLFNNTSNQFGALVVTSKLDGVKVTIDENEVTDPNFYPFSNQTPFVVPKIPTGTHVLRAKKEGYLVQKITVDIQNNKITDQVLNLILDNNIDNLKKAEIKMPITTKEYVIEYLNFIGIVQVNIRQSPYEESKQKAVDWFKSQGINDPESQGVVFLDLTKTYVH